MKLSQGSIIIYALLLVAVLLSAGLSATAITIIKLRSASQAVNSTIAVYAADSATEVCLYEARRNDAFGRNVTPPGCGGAGCHSTILTNGAYFTIASSSTPAACPPTGSCDITLDCTPLSAGGSFKFRASGTYKGVTRSLEVSQ